MFRFLFNQPIFPEITPGSADLPGFCWCEFIYRADALPVTHKSNNVKALEG